MSTKLTYTKREEVDRECRYIICTEYYGHDGTLGGDDILLNESDLHFLKSNGKNPHIRDIIDEIEIRGETIIKLTP